MSDLNLIITNAGRAALINAANTGTAPVTIATVGVTATAIVPAPTVIAIPAEIKRIATLSGDIVADDTIHMVVRDESSDTYTVRSFGLYLADGTLFAVYGQADPIMEKSAQSLLLLAIDVQFADVAATEVTFGDTNFLNPPATTESLGIVELATSAEALVGTDQQRVITPKAMAVALLNALDTRLGADAPTAFIKTLLAAANVGTARGVLGLKSAALKDEGAGGTLDADTLDGQQGAWYANIPARLGFNPLPAASFTPAAILAMLLTVDGGGSGLDADTVDGLDSSQLRAWSNILGKPFNYAGQSGQPSWLWGTNDGVNFYVWNPSNFSVANADTVDGYHASDLLPTSLAGGGFRLPTGHMVQGGSGVFPRDAYSSITFPVAFPNTCISCVMGGATEVGNPNAQANGPMVYGLSRTGASIYSAADGVASHTAWWIAVGN